MSKEQKKSTFRPNSNDKQENSPNLAITPKRNYSKENKTSSADFSLSNISNRSYESQSDEESSSSYTSSEDSYNIQEDFFQSCKDNDLEKVRYYCEQGFDINAKNQEGLAALHIIVMQDTTIQEKRKILKLLRGFKVDVNIRDNSQKTPLHLAVEKDDMRLVTFLVDHLNANIDAVNKFNNSPLQRATHFKNKRSEDIIKFLLKKGGRITDDDSNTQTLETIPEEVFLGVLETKEAKEQDTKIALNRNKRQINTLNYQEITQNITTILNQNKTGNNKFSCEINNDISKTIMTINTPKLMERHTITTNLKNLINQKRQDGDNVNFEVQSSNFGLNKNKGGSIKIDITNANSTDLDLLKIFISTAQNQPSPSIFSCSSSQKLMSKNNNSVQKFH